MNITMKNYDSLINFKNGDKHDLIVHNSSEHKITFHFNHDYGYVTSVAFELGEFFMPLDILFAVSFEDNFTDRAIFMTKTTVVVMEFDNEAKKVVKQY